jgi:hypothetical protein
LPPGARAPSNITLDLSVFCKKRDLLYREAEGIRPNPEMHMVQGHLTRRPARKVPGAAKGTRAPGMWPVT